MGANELVESLEQGVSGAYKSVMKPTEGTILTVARESAEKAREMLHSTNDPIIIMEEVCKQAELSTKHQSYSLHLPRQALLTQAARDFSLSLKQ